MKELYIVGAGGFGREVAWLVERINKCNEEWNLKGFIDDNNELHGKKEGRYQIIAGTDYLLNINRDIWVVCAVGAASTRKKIIKRIESNKNIHFATLVDPAVLLSDRVEIGEGSIICAGCIITVDINIGKHVIVNLDCTIGHDARLCNYVTVYPSVNISGFVTIEDEAEIGTGTQIIQGKTIEKETIIGAGSVVVKDIPAKCTAVGSPAKPIKFRE
ncbi:acetyltransferase [Ruminococcus sp. CLA-AA-H200]|uniref:Acetyltransferase n=1 Tax=Ruminococcus turbiniformis TaxID=2881258 RepID=A0ABS8G169_9FIRM|nr:acetyltransferase [Ruminococcus turbiniformis]MCC2256050.1 acetyltransferase [Ruminococcus turbiniformis]